MSKIADVAPAADLKRHLFYETSHSPSVVDLVGYEKAKEITDFCFIANPYYPTPQMLQDLQKNLPNLIKSYPSSNPVISQKHLAEVLHVDPEHLIIGNGATELIALINTALVDRIAVPVPTFGEYIEKLKDQRDAELYMLSAEDRYRLRLDEYLCRSQMLNVVCGGTLFGDVRKEKDSELIHINPGEHYDDYRHPVSIVPETPLAKWYGEHEINVNSYHHQGVRRLARRFRSMAHAPDGLVEAYYDPKAPFVVGLQFHPERMLHEYSGNLEVWKAFTRAVHANAESKPNQE